MAGNGAHQRHSMLVYLVLALPARLTVRKQEKDPCRSLITVRDS